MIYKEFWLKAVRNLYSYWKDYNEVQES